MMTTLVPMIQSGLLLPRIAVSQVVIVVSPLSRPDVRPRLHAVETRVLDARQPDRRHQVVMRANGERPVLVIGVFGHFDAVVLQLLHHGFRFKVTEDSNEDRKSTRLNSSHTVISYAVFCLKKKKTHGFRKTLKTRYTKLTITLNLRRNTTCNIRSKQLHKTSTDPM